MENIYRYFNCKIRQVLEKYEIKNIYEIRIRVNKNVILNTGTGEIILDVICNEKDVIDTFNLITEFLPTHTSRIWLKGLLQFQAAIE